MSGRRTEDILFPDQRHTAVSGLLIQDVQIVFIEEQTVSSFSAGLPQSDLPGSRAEVFVEEGADFAEGFFRFGSLIVEQVMRVRLAFEDLQLRIDARLAELAVHANGVAQEQVAGAGGGRNPVTRNPVTDRTITNE
jgi:hypothetical protein